MSQSRSGQTHDELHLDMTLPVVYLSLSSGHDNLPWQLDTDVLTTAGSWSTAVAGAGSNSQDPPVMSDDHATPLRGGMGGFYFGGSPYGGAYVYNRATNGATSILQGYAGFHNGGGLVQQRGGELLHNRDPVQRSVAHRRAVLE